MPIPYGPIAWLVTLADIVPEEMWSDDARIQRVIGAVSEVPVGQGFKSPVLALPSAISATWSATQGARASVREDTMGFLSSLVKGIKGVTSPIVKGIGAVFGPATPLGQAARVLSPSIGRVAVPAAAALGGAAIGAAAGYAAGSPDSTGMAGMGGGNGRYVTVTTVTTIDTVTGDAVRQKMLQGSPYLMNRDLMVAKRVLRTAGKLGSRFSRKVREPSKTKLLMDAIQDRALGAVLQGAAGCGPHGA